jgi:hypothetical protein
MNDENKKLKVVIAPGAFDSFDGTQEELDELMAEINKMVESGEIHEKSRLLTEEDIEDLDDETLEAIINQLGSIEDDEFPDRKLH